MTTKGAESVRTILAIEASNPSSGGGGVCVGRVGADGSVRVLAAAGLTDAARAGDAVMPAVEGVCAQAGVTPGDIDQIAVSVGPGGYTALRIATTTGKALAHAIGCDAVAVPTARVAAAALGDADLPAVIALAGKKGAAHLTLVHADGSCQELGVGGPGLIRAGMARTIVGDAHVPAEIAEHASGLGMRRVAITLEPVWCLRASVDIGPCTADGLEPIYAREPDAVTQWRARGD